MLLLDEFLEEFALSLFRRRSARFLAIYIVLSIFTSGIPQHKVNEIGQQGRRNGRTPRICRSGLIFHEKYGDDKGQGNRSKYYYENFYIQRFIEGNIEFHKKIGYRLMQQTVKDRLICPKLQDIPVLQFRLDCRFLHP